jgi:hypothetical protein
LKIPQYQGIRGYCAHVIGVPRAEGRQGQRSAKGRGKLEQHEETRFGEIMVFTRRQPQEGTPTGITK